MHIMEYDYLILGGGWGGLTQAALQVKAGKKVCILEATNQLGGFAKSVTKKGYTFCVGPQYLTECHKGGDIYNFLKKIKLEKKIKFKSLNKNCYDRIRIPTANFDIPINLKLFKKKLIQQFPEEKEKINELFKIMNDMHKAIKKTPIKDFNDFITKIKTGLIFIRYGTWTIKRMFDHLQLSKPLRAILSAQCGDYGLRPEKAMFCAQFLVFYAYGTSASYPEKGFDFMIKEIADYIKQNSGTIKLNSKVKKIYTKNNKVTKIKTTDNKIYTAKNYISNIDPEMTMRLINKSKSVYDYPYSSACFSIFLGLNTSLKQYGFGNWNVWNYADVNIDNVWKKIIKTNSYKKPFLFMSTPSEYTTKNQLCPKGGTTLHIMTPANYNHFMICKKKGTYNKEVNRVTNEILDYLETNFIPDLRKKIVIKEVWSPLDYYVNIPSPKANIYGKKLDAKTVIFKQVSTKTKYYNLFLTGATTSFPGLGSVLSGSLELFKQLD